MLKAFALYLSTRRPSPPTQSNYDMTYRGVVLHGEGKWRSDTTAIKGHGGVNLALLGYGALYGDSSDGLRPRGYEDSVIRQKLYVIGSVV